MEALLAESFEKDHSILVYGLAPAMYRNLQVSLKASQEAAVPGLLLRQHLGGLVASQPGFLKLWDCPTSTPKGPKYVTMGYLGFRTRNRNYGFGWMP